MSNPFPSSRSLAHVKMIKSLIYWAVCGFNYHYQMAAMVYEQLKCKYLFSCLTAGFGFTAHSSWSCSPSFAGSWLAKPPKITKTKHLHSPSQHFYSCLNLKLTFHGYSLLPVPTKVLLDKLFGFEGNKFKEREKANSTLGFPFPLSHPRPLTSDRDILDLFSILYLPVCLGMC